MKQNENSCAPPTTPPLRPSGHHRNVIHILCAVCKFPCHILLESSSRTISLIESLFVCLSFLCCQVLTPRSRRIAHVTRLKWSTLTPKPSLVRVRVNGFLIFLLTRCRSSCLFTRCRCPCSPDAGLLVDPMLVFLLTRYRSSCSPDADLLVDSMPIFLFTRCQSSCLFTRCRSSCSRNADLLVHPMPIVLFVHAIPMPSCSLKEMAERTFRTHYLKVASSSLVGVTFCVSSAEPEDLCAGQRK